MAGVFETSRPPRDTSNPAKPHLIIFPGQFYQLRIFSFKPLHNDSKFPTWTYDLLRHGLLTKVPIPDMGSLLQRRMQIQSEELFMVSAEQTVVLLLYRWTQLAQKFGFLGHSVQSQVRPWSPLSPQPLAYNPLSDTLPVVREFPAHVHFAILHLVTRVQIRASSLIYKFWQEAKRADKSLHCLRGLWGPRSGISQGIVFSSPLCLRIALYRHAQQFHLFSLLYFIWVVRQQVSIEVFNPPFYFG